MKCMRWGRESVGDYLPRVCRWVRPAERESVTCALGLCVGSGGLGGCDLDPVLHIRVLLVFLVIPAPLEKVAPG